MFNNLKLRGRILWGYSIPLLLSTGVAAIVFVNIRRVENQLQMVETAHTIVYDAKDVAFHIATIQKATRGYLLQKTGESYQTYTKAKEDAEKQLTVLKLLVKDPVQQQNLSSFFDLVTQIDTFNTGLIDLVNQGKTNQAIVLWRGGKGRELSEELRRLVNAFEARESEILHQRQQGVEASLGLLNLTVLVGNLLSSILVIGIGLWIASLISKIVNQAVSQVASSSTQIAATVEQQERTFSQQASSVNQTTTTMGELGASSRQSAEQAEASASGARQALTLAEGGTKSVQRTMKGMSTLKEKVGAISEQILRLSEQTNQISNISGLVGDLANQTNMLALNAAVEAARAGESGKGFGVVAQEIRKLADQSKKSSEKINVLVADIQAAINKTAMVTDEGTKEVEAGIKLTQGTAENFTGVADSVNDVCLNSQQISLNAKQQAIAIQQVLEAMNAINFGAQESASGINQVKITTQQLSQAALQLKAFI